jgi:hypothetical protein
VKQTTHLHLRMRGAIPPPPPAKHGDSCTFHFYLSMRYTCKHLLKDRGARRYGRWQDCHLTSDKSTRVISLTVHLFSSSSHICVCVRACVRAKIKLILLLFLFSDVELCSLNGRVTLCGTDFKSFQASGR